MLSFQIRNETADLGNLTFLTHLTQNAKKFLYVLAFGLSLSRTSSVAILRYHFNDENIHFALSVSMMGLIPGLAILPMAAEYVFTKYGFSKTMLLLVPLMSLHLLSGLTYVQTSKEQASEELAAKEQEYMQASKEHASVDNQNTEKRKQFEENISENKEDARKRIVKKIMMAFTNAKVYLHR